MHVSPLSSPAPEPPPEPLPESCFAGGPVSPISTGYQEVEAPSSPQSAEPQPPPVATPRRRRSPTPVELQDTRLRTVTTPTYRGGESSVRIHQRRRDREASAQPSAAPSDAAGHIPSALVIPPVPSDHREATAQPSAAPSDAAGHLPSAVVIPPTPSDQQYPQQYYPHYQSAPFLPSGYPQPPGMAMYPQQLHIPAHMHQWPPQGIPYASYSHPPESRTTSPFLPPSAELEHQYHSAPLSGGTALSSNKAAPPPSHAARSLTPSLPPIAHVRSLTPAPAPVPPAARSLIPSLPPIVRAPSPSAPSARPLTPAPAPPLPAADAAVNDDNKPPSPSAPSVRPLTPAPAPVPPAARSLIPSLPHIVRAPSPSAPSAPPLPAADAAVNNDNELKTEDHDDSTNPFIDPLSPPISSPPASADGPKAKFKVGRRSKEDQEDWDQFVEQCNLMYQNYAKKKKMPDDQVFSQYSAFRRRLNANADSQWNAYQKLWAKNLEVERERAREHIAFLVAKGDDVENIENMSLQALCAYGYAGYKLKYSGDWKERLEVYNDLDVVSGEPMEYRTRTKAWNKYIDNLNRLSGTAYNNHEFNTAWVAVGSAILNDQGLQASGETDGVKGVWEIKFRCPNGYEKIHIKAHSHHVLSVKLLDAEWGDETTSTNPLSIAKAGPSSHITDGSPMKVENSQEALTLFGVDAEEFKKLSDINKLRKCWTYFTLTVDPKWDEGHQLLWKGRLAKYAFRGIRVRSYPYGCLVPGQTLLTPSKGIADTPGDQVKSVLGAFGVPGYAPVEHPIIFEIVDDETKDRMLSNKLPVLVEMPPPPGSAATHARQHYADGHVDNGGPSWKDLDKRMGKRAVASSAAEPPAAPPPPIDMFAPSSTSLAKPSTSMPPPTHIPPPARGGQHRPQIHMQSHEAAAKAPDITVISSSPEQSPTPKPKGRKRPLSVDGESNLRPLYDSDDDGKQDQEVGNIFQRGTTVRRGRGSSQAAQRTSKSKLKSTSTSTTSIKPKADSKKTKYKSSAIVVDSPSPPPTTTSKPRPVPRLVPASAPLSATVKSPTIQLPLNNLPSLKVAVRQASSEPPAHHLSHEPRSASTGSAPPADLASIMQPPSPSIARPQTMPPPQDRQLPPPPPPPTTTAQATYSSAHVPPNTIYYDGTNPPHNSGYAGPPATTGYPTPQYFNQSVVYHPQHAAHPPLQEGGGMPRHEGSPLPMGGHHMQITGGVGAQQRSGGGQQMQMQMGAGQMGGMPMQWPGGGMYYGAPMSYPTSSYGYSPIMGPPQLHPAGQEPHYAHRPAGDYTPNTHPAPEHEHREG